MAWGAHLFFGLPIESLREQGLTLFLIALGLAILHWAIASYHLVDRVLAAIGARPLDPEDAYHRRLRNLIEEVGVATGGRHRVEPYVISTTAMNACAIADWHGRCAIAVTEGLLARLTRSQLEAVIGHEAAHIASGDSLANSLVCGLFGLHEEAFKRLSGLFGGRRSADLFRGRAGAFLVFILIVLWLTTLAKRLCHLAISRTQEYRADAVAVRLTRNPLGLAEALHQISKHWRGAGMEGESLSVLFILDPGLEALSEREGLFADWLSTHPPTDRRIEALLGMAHLAPPEFARAMAAPRKRPKHLRRLEEPIHRQPAPSQWWMWVNEAWVGPFSYEALIHRQDLEPHSWIRREGTEVVLPAYHDPEVLAGLRQRYGGSDSTPSGRECPTCRLILRRTLYEGVPVDECPACRGCYVTRDQVSRVLVREDYEFPESVRRLASALPDQRSRQRLLADPGKRPWIPFPGRRCAACGSAVVRKFYNPAYFVEVEQCWVCGLAWLDRGELELLQYLYEQRGGTA
ncbi:MAG: M48 family metalloprotease [Candidatus Omnitrophica bacterium]|nr:M48 family metalloprotease [Candidatus Omnitrophota bacterium]